MKVALFKVSNERCGSCSTALRSFIGGIDGVGSIDVEHGQIAVRFDENAIDEVKLTSITKDSIEKLGYRIEE